MRLLDGLRLAAAQVRTYKLKSFFSMLGVLIGAMFLIAVVSIVNGMDRYMTEDFAQRIYGLNTLTVRRFPSINFNPSPEIWREWRRRPRLTFADATAIREQLGSALVAVESRSDGRLEAEDGTQIENVWLAAVSADYFRIREYRIARGRLFGALEDRRGAAVVVVGYEAAAKLFGQLDPIGRTVRVEGFPFRVIGVLEKQGTLFGISLDNLAIAPARSAMARMVNRPRVVDQILVRAASAEELEQARLGVEASMRVRHELRPTVPNDFEIETAEDSMAFWTRISRILYIAFPGLVAIALVVGGLVIMNIMLVSVAERTREIGVRKALGAKRKDILLQVLIESAGLSGAGAAAGIGIGIVLAQIIEASSPLPAAIGPIWVAGAAVLGIGVGVVAGLYPASRAAGLDPVVALRQE